MMRALWTGASGMISQQTNVDNISHNLSNVNTTGYKKMTTEFQSLLYQKIQKDVTDKNGDPKPVIGQVGLGVRVSSVVSQFTQGNLLETGNEFDMAIDGNGFFQIRMPDGSTAYTRNGSFVPAIGTEGITLSTSAGYPVLNTALEPIVFAADADVSKIQMDEDGNFSYLENSSTVTPLNIQVGLAQFNNPSGLEKLSGSLLRATENSGEPRLESEDDALKISKLRQKYLEGSNVQTVDEIVNLIVAQRAYEMNSKVITASDEMLQQANNLRR